MHAPPPPHLPPELQQRLTNVARNQRLPFNTLDIKVRRHTHNASTALADLHPLA
jgi:hypothetical protein